MRRIVLLIVGIAAAATGAHAQSNAELVEQALHAAPGRARDGAAVITWNADFSYETIKEGTNQVVCYSRANERDRQPFAVQCTQASNLERVAQNRQLRAESTDAATERAAVAAADSDGSRVLPVYGTWFRSSNGPEQAGAGVHTTIAMPGATGESTGFPESRDGGGAWLMAAGTSEAHLMVP